MKNFKNTFGVTGTLALRKAFREELLALGWKQQGEDEIEDVKYIYCSSNNEHSLEANHFWYPTSADKNVYKLPEQYEEALKVASEVVEEIPEYVECIRSGITSATKGKIYKVVKLDEDVLTYIDNFGNENLIANVLSKGKGTGHTDFKPSTKEAFYAQNKPVFKVGDWVVVTEDIKKSDWSQADESVGFIFQLNDWKDYDAAEEVEGLNKGKEIVSPGNKYGINYTKNWLRLATPKEIAEVTKPKFKVGDWIKRTWNDGDIDTFKIESINPPSYRYSYFTRSTCKGLLKEGLCQISDDRFTDELIPAPKSFSDKVTLTLGTSNIKITVYKDGKVEAEGHEGTIKQVKQFIDSMVWKRSELGWNISYPLIQIGCSKFTLKELQKIVTTYDEFNS